MTQDFHLVSIYRNTFQSDRTFGKLYCTEICENEQYFCNTLEDAVRGEGIKIPGKTAIPSNDMDSLFNAEIRISPKFGKIVVIYTRKIEHEGYNEYILEHKGTIWRYILFHGGSSEEDSAGCILVAEFLDIERNKFWGSMQNEFTELVERLLKSGPVKVLITNKTK